MFKAFEVLISIFLWIFLVLPVISVPVVVLYSWLLLVRFYILFRNLKNPAERIEVLRFSDLCYSDAVTGIYGFHVTEINGAISLEQLRQHIFSTFLKGGNGMEKFPAFYSVFEENVLGFTCKKVKHFSDERLLQNVREDWKMEGESDTETLGRIVRDDSRLKGDNPKWEIVLVKRSFDKTTTIFKFHHALFDGNCSKFLFEQLTEVVKPGKQFSGMELTVFEKLYFFVLGPLIIYRFIKSVPAVEKDSHPFLGKENDWNPTGIFEKDKVHLRLGGSSPLDFTRLKSSAKKIGVKVSSILIYLQIRICEEAGRRRCAGNGFKNPDGVVITIIVPPPEYPVIKGKKLGNYLNFIQLPVPLSGSIRGRRIAHLEAISRNMRNYEVSGMIPVTYMIFNCFPPPTWVVKMMASKKNTDFPLFCTALPIADKYTLLGHDVVYIAGGGLKAGPVPQDVNRGCSMAFVTKGDNTVASGFMSDEMVSSQQEMEELMGTFLPNELEGLLNEIDECSKIENIV